MIPGREAERHLPSRRSFQLASPDPVPERRQGLRYEFEPTGEPDIRNGKGVPGEAYEPPVEFTGTIHSVTFDVSGELITDDEAELARLMAQQ